MRRAQGLSRLGLSSTFPETVRQFDGWLELPERFPELHARRSWRQSVLAQADVIAQTRARFLGGLAQQLNRGLEKQGLGEQGLAAQGLAEQGSGKAHRDEL